VGRVPNEEAAAQRARWLAELSDSLDEARLLINQLRDTQGSIDATELYARIEAAKLEVQAMRIKRSGGGADFGPEWTKGIPWRLSA
jgi:hypothetical protein